MRARHFLACAIGCAQALAQLHFVDKAADGDPDIDVLRGCYNLACSPDGRFVYAPGALDNGLVVLAVDPVPGTLAYVEDHVDGTGGLTSLAGIRGTAVSGDGKHLYTAALTDSAVTVFSRDQNSGALTFVQAVFDLQTGGSFDGLGGAMAVIVSEDGSHVYVAARSDDAVLAFSRNATTGQLTLIAVYQDVAMDGPESLRLSPDGDHVYVAAVNSHALLAFQRNPTTGALTFLNAYKDGLNGVDGLGCVNDLVISPDGLNLYTVGYYGASSSSCTTGFDDWLAIFARDPMTGALDYQAKLDPASFPLAAGCSGVASGNGMAASPNGSMVFATAQWRGAVLALTRDPEDGLLDFDSYECADLGDPNAITDLLTAHRLIQDPYGARVLVSSLSPGGVVVFETEAYNAYRGAMAAWPNGNVRDLTLRINELGQVYVSP